MAIEIPPSYGQVTWSGVTPGSGRPWAVVCGFAWIESDPNSVADYLSGSWAATILGIQIDELSFAGAKVVMNVGGTLVGAESGVGAGVGAASGEPGLVNASVLVRKNTGLIGRRHQGRMFLPGVRESGSNDGANLTTGELVLWAGVVNDLFDAMSDGTELLQPVILHDESLATTPTVVNSFQTQSLLATQRRRLRK